VNGYLINSVISLLLIS